MTRRKTYAHVSRTISKNGSLEAASRTVPEEVPVAFTYGGTTHAVMMATPADIEDFAIGFSLSEQIIRMPTDIVNMDVLDVGEGIDVQMELTKELQSNFTAARRAMAGPVGCGLCGIESIEDILRELPELSENKFQLSHEIVSRAVEQLDNKQEIRAETGAVHAAGFLSSSGDLELIREDVGRHNALDKLLGALARENRDTSKGAIVLTSRVSVDLIQKIAISGTPILIAVSTPTALAIRTAEQAGLTLIALARVDSFEIYTHPNRVQLAGVQLAKAQSESNSDVA
ncbi:formate dehydrogenase accessory sulfurtransferase FdhD [Lentilitoribacter sp. EG35]|uniref:formate dehydrogenase accessory sulfurtransferase FdhD n=1 Tax=Lentilitoribacter sp. EG35 TaxID=3234192 RepID=UPI00345F491D